MFLLLLVLLGIFGSLRHLKWSILDAFKTVLRVGKFAQVQEQVEVNSFR